MHLGREQRRSRRFRVELEVELHEKSGSRRARTLDVARHGMFIALPTPPHNRHLVQLTIHLPAGAIRAAATVTRVLPGEGFGVQLFALADEAKRAWDAFSSALMNPGTQKASTAGAPPYGSSAPPHPTASTPPVRTSSGTFLVKLHSVERLRDYCREHVAVGGTVLFTPVLAAPGTSVTLAIVHPLTEEEFLLNGTVVRAYAERPKRLEIGFDDTGPALTDRFSRFAATGSAPRRQMPPPPPTPAPRTDFELDVDVLDDSLPDGEVVDWSLSAMDSGSLDVTLPGLEPITSPSGRQSQGTAPDTAAAHPLPVPDPASGDGLALEEQGAAHDPGLHPVAVRLVCDDDTCSSEPYVIELGPCRGILGLVADQFPFWSSAAGRVVAVPRLVAPNERKRRYHEYGRNGGQIEDMVAIAHFLAAADLAEEPRHPETGEALKTSRAIERLLPAVRRAAEEDAVSPTRVKCPSCNMGHLVVEPTQH